MLNLTISPDYTVEHPNSWGTWQLTEINGEKGWDDVKRPAGITMAALLSSGLAFIIHKEGDEWKLSEPGREGVLQGLMVWVNEVTLPRQERYRSAAGFVNDVNQFNRGEVLSWMLEGGEFASCCCCWDHEAMFADIANHIAGNPFTLENQANVQLPDSLVCWQYGEILQEVG